MMVFPPASFTIPHFPLLTSYPSANQGFDGCSVIVMVFRGQACLVLLLIHYLIA